MDMTTQMISDETVAPRKAPWLCIGYRAGYVVRDVNTKVAHLPDELEGARILHLSDLHITRRWHKAYDKLLAAVSDWDVDVILCTGDIVDDRSDHRPAWEQVRRFFPALKSRLGTYTILGNHDNPRMIPELQAMGVRVLQGERMELDFGGAALEVIGTPGHKREHLPAGFAAKFPARVKGTPRVLMSHFPDHFYRLSALEPDLYLCGHTHGGQICLPGGIPILRHDSTPRRHCRGEHRRGKTHVIVNHGFGFSGLNLRMFCPPEVVMIRLG